MDIKKSTESKKLEKTVKELERLRDSGEIDKTLEMIKMLSDSDYTELSESDIENFTKWAKEFKATYKSLQRGMEKWMKKYRNIGH